MTDNARVSFEVSSKSLINRMDVAFYAVRRKIEAALPPKTGTPLEELCKHIRTKTPGKEAYTTSGVPCLKLRNITADFIETTDVQYVTIVAASKYVAAQTNDIIVTATGEGTAGRACIFNEKGKWIVTGENILLRPHPGAVNPFYLLAMLRSHLIASQLTAYVRGATGQTHLYWQDIASIRIPLADEPTQNHCEEMFLEGEKLMKEAKSLLAQFRAKGEAAMKAVGVKDGGV